MSGRATAPAPLLSPIRPLWKEANGVEDKNSDRLPVEVVEGGAELLVAVRVAEGQPLSSLLQLSPATGLLGSTGRVASSVDCQIDPAGSRKDRVVLAGTV